MEQSKLPKLTKKQKKRFRKFLVEYGRVETFMEALEATDSDKNCKTSFFQVYDFLNVNFNSDYIDDLIKGFDLEDIFEVYTVDYDVEDSNQIYDKGLNGSNCIYDKDEQPLLEPNCISDKVESGLEVSNQIYDKVLPSDDLPVVQICSNEGNKPAESSNQIYDKRGVRGKQKEPLKTAILVRLDSIQLEELKALGGNTNEHIRRAISSYLDSVQNQTD